METVVKFPVKRECFYVTNRVIPTFIDNKNFRFKPSIIRSTVGIHAFDILFNALPWLDSFSLQNYVLPSFVIGHNFAS